MMEGTIILIKPHMDVNNYVWILQKGCVCFQIRGFHWIVNNKFFPYILKNCCSWDILKTYEFFFLYLNRKGKLEYVCFRVWLKVRKSTENEQNHSGFWVIMKVFLCMYISYKENSIVPFYFGKSTISECKEW